MRRAALLGLVAVLALAGCTSTLDPTGTGTPGTPGASPTATPTTTSPGTAPPCDAVEQTTVDPYRDDVEPSELPEPPSERTETTVSQYVVAFEKAYSRNGALSKISTKVTVSVTDVSVEETDEGWVVHLTSRTNTWAAGTDTADGTPTVVHGDGALIPVTYHVTDEGLYRIESDYGETPAPDQRGTPVACFD